MNGHGTYHERNGDVYIGHFKDDNYHGNGKMSYKAQSGDICTLFYEGLGKTINETAMESFSLVTELCKKVSSRTIYSLD